MALMEILKANKINTTSSMVLQAGNTGTAAYLFDRSISLGFTSVGYDSTTSAVIGFTFATPTVLSHILLQNHNLKQFRVYYNSVTANSLANFTTNSESSTYLSFSSITVNSVDIQMDLAMTTGVDKSIGEMVLTERDLVFERNPSIKDFSPTTTRTRVIHEMPDGGVTMYNIANKFKATLKWQFITNGFTTSLLSIYNSALPIYYVPFPTSTGWSGEAYEVLWTNDFNFNYNDNSKSQGQGGTIEFRQTANT